MQSGGLQCSNTQATKSIFCHSSASTWTVFDLWLMFYLFFSVQFTWDSTFFRGWLGWEKVVRRRKSDQGLFACYQFICFPCGALAERINVPKKRAFIDIIKSFAQKMRCDCVLELRTQAMLSPSHIDPNLARKKSAAIYVEIIIIDKTTISADDLGLVIISCALRLKESCEWLSNPHGQEMFSSFLLHLRCSFSYFISHSGCLVGGGGGMLFIIHLGQTQLYVVNQ